MSSRQSNDQTATEMKYRSNSTDQTDKARGGVTLELGCERQGLQTSTGMPRGIQDLNMEK